jgi:hypothetical protein
MPPKQQAKSAKQKKEKAKQEKEKTQAECLHNALTLRTHPYLLKHWVRDAPALEVDEATIALFDQFHHLIDMMRDCAIETGDEFQDWVRQVRTLEAS